jgi:hypothetical protein
MTEPDHFTLYKRWVRITCAAGIALALSVWLPHSMALATSLLGALQLFGLWRWTLHGNRWHEQFERRARSVRAERGKLIG